jgi:hypothetical protein
MRGQRSSSLAARLLLSNCNLVVIEQSSAGRGSPELSVTIPAYALFGPAPKSPGASHSATPKLNCQRALWSKQQPTYAAITSPL